MSKYDCSKCLDYEHERKRMCKYYNGDCHKCDVGDFHFSCFISDLQDKIDTVQKWSDEHPEHPEKTILEDFHEKYPNCKLEDGTPVICVNNLCDVKERCLHTMSCTDCWNRPLSEVMR